MSERYKFLKNVFDKNNSLDDEYIHYRSVIEYKLNNKGIPYLNWWIIFLQRKLEKEGIRYANDEEVLPYALDLIGELLKEKKVKAEYFEIEEYEKPRKVKIGRGKLEKEIEIKWKWKRIGWLDPCKIEDKEELEKRVEEWKEKLLKVYKYALSKYNEKEVNVIFDILEIVRSDCYEGEIRIE